MGLFHRHHWVEQSRITDFIDERDVVELRCHDCGELRNQRVASTHQHDFDPEPVREYDKRLYDPFTNLFYTKHFRILECVTCHVREDFVD